MKPHFARVDVRESSENTARDPFLTGERRYLLAGEVGEGRPCPVFAVEFPCAQT